MNVRFGNLSRPRHSSAKGAEGKIKEMMKALNEAGFSQESSIEKNQYNFTVKTYHIFDLPHTISFSPACRDDEEFLSIMRPYEDYMKPLAVESLVPGVRKDGQDAS